MTRLDRLRTALKYSSGADRRAIRAMIAAIETEAENHHGDTEGTEFTVIVSPPMSKTGARQDDGSLMRPGAKRCDLSPCPPCLRGEPEIAEAIDWRVARRAMRRAGHEVKQLDGVVYVDGAGSDDPALQAA